LRIDCIYTIHSEPKAAGYGFLHQWIGKYEKFLYCIAQNFGGKKHWRMKLHLPMFFLPII